MKKKHFGAVIINADDEEDTSSIISGDEQARDAWAIAKLDVLVKALDFDEPVETIQDVRDYIEPLREEGFYVHLFDEEIDE